MDNWTGGFGKGIVSPDRLITWNVTDPTGSPYHMDVHERHGIPKRDPKHVDFWVYPDGSTYYYDSRAGGYSNDFGDIQKWMAWHNKQREGTPLTLRGTIEADAPHYDPRDFNMQGDLTDFEEYNDDAWDDDLNDKLPSRYDLDHEWRKNIFNSKTAAKIDYLRDPQSRPDLQDEESKQFLGHMQNTFWNERSDDLFPLFMREFKNGNAQMTNTYGNTQTMMENYPNYNRLAIKFTPQQSYQKSMEYLNERGYDTAKAQQYFDNDHTLMHVDAAHPWWQDPMYRGLQWDMNGKRPGDPEPEERINWMTHRVIAPQEMKQIEDWYHSKHPTRRGVDINNKSLSFHDIWDRTQQYTADMKRKQDKRQIRHKFDDGWKIRELLPDDCPEVGKQLSNCLGGYGENVKRGDAILYTLQDEKDNHKVAMEVRPTHYYNTQTKEVRNVGHSSRPYHDATESEEDNPWIALPQHGHVIQGHASGNQEPSDEYKQRFAEFFNSKHFRTEDGEDKRPNWEHDDTLDLDGHVNYGIRPDPEEHWGLPAPHPPPVDFEDKIREDVEYNEDGAYSADDLLSFASRWDIEDELHSAASMVYHEAKDNFWEDPESSGSYTEPDVYEWEMDNPQPTHPNDDPDHEYGEIEEPDHEDYPDDPEGYEDAMEEYRTKKEAYDTAVEDHESLLEDWERQKEDWLENARREAINEAWEEHPAYSMPDHYNINTNPRRNRWSKRRKKRRKKHRLGHRNYHYGLPCFCGFVRSEHWQNGGNNSNSTPAPDSGGGDSGGGDGGGGVSAKVAGTGRIQFTNQPVYSKLPNHEWRLPVIYDHVDDKAFVGQPGMEHRALAQNFDLPDPWASMEAGQGAEGTYHPGFFDLNGSVTEGGLHWYGSPSIPNEHQLHDELEEHFGMRSGSPEDISWDEEPVAKTAGPHNTGPHLLDDWNVVPHRWGYPPGQFPDIPRKDKGEAPAGVDPSGQFSVGDGMDDPAARLKWNGANTETTGKAFLDEHGRLHTWNEYIKSNGRQYEDPDAGPWMHASQAYARGVRTDPETHVYIDENGSIRDPYGVGRNSPDQMRSMLEQGRIHKMWHPLAEFAEFKPSEVHEEEDVDWDSHHASYNPVDDEEWYDPDEPVFSAVIPEPRWRGSK